VGWGDNGKKGGGSFNYKPYLFQGATFEKQAIDGKRLTVLGLSSNCKSPRMGHISLERLVEEKKKGFATIRGRTHGPCRGPQSRKALGNATGTGEGVIKNRSTEG